MYVYMYVCIHVCMYVFIYLFIINQEATITPCTNKYDNTWTDNSHITKVSYLTMHITCKNKLITAVKLVTYTSHNIHT